MGQLEDRITSAIHQQFNILPNKSKPQSTDGTAEWVPLSGIVVVRDNDIDCLALGTGMKCLPTSKNSLSKGNILHDWHAEIVAIRAFNHALVEECRKLALRDSSNLLRWRDRTSVQGSQPFTLREGLRIFMYCSEAPCGDASMELVMEAQEDATPWPKESTGAMLGRGSFSELGIVRRKPARGDSPSTLSKSCSDKLALKQCISLLSGPVSLLVSPENAYLDTLILPEGQYKEESCIRAFGPTGRMKPLAGKAWPPDYFFRPFKVATTAVDFSFSRQSAREKSKVIKGSNTSATWTHQMTETLINGVLQGRKQCDPKGASMLSRKRMNEAIMSTFSLLGPLSDLQYPSYKQLKESELLDERRRVKGEATIEALKGWIKNDMDDFECGVT